MTAFCELSPWLGNSRLSLGASNFRHEHQASDFSHRLSQAFEVTLIRFVNGLLTSKIASQLSCLRGGCRQRLKFAEENEEQLILESETAQG